MRKLVFMLLFFTGLFVNAQSIDDLDRNPSFKGITIGTPVSKYHDILEFLDTTDGTDVYRITNKAYLSIFNIPMEKMLVLVKNGEVKAITARVYQQQTSNGVNKFDGSSMLTLLGELMKKYGRPNVSLDKTENKANISGSRWNGKKYSIDIKYTFYAMAEYGTPYIDYALYENAPEDY